MPDSRLVAIGFVSGGTSRDNSGKFIPDVKNTRKKRPKSYTPPPALVADSVEEQMLIQSGTDLAVPFTRLSGASCASFDTSLTSVSFASVLASGIQVAALDSSDSALINFPGSLTPYVQISGFLVSDAFSAAGVLEVDITATVSKVLNKVYVPSGDFCYVTFSTIMQLAEIGSSGAPSMRLQVKLTAGGPRSITAGEINFVLLRQ